MSEFFTILPPPQSVDTLDAWGSLDDLPYSLDSAVWQSVGVYGLVASEGGESGEALRGDAVTRGLSCRATASSSGAMKGAKVTYLAGEGSAKSGGSLKVAAIRGVGGRGEAVSSGKLAFIAIRALFDTEPAVSGGGMLGVKVTYLSGSGQAVAHEAVKVNFTRGLVVDSTAKAGGVADVGRVLIVAGDGASVSSDDALVGFKGWDWSGEKSPSAPVWEQKNEQLTPWMQKAENAAVWAAQSVTAKDWTQKQGGVAQWQ